jgi:hypothetical protein
MKLHPSVQSLLNEIEDFLDRTGETPTAFGIAALNDGRFLPLLKKGRAPSIVTVEKVRAYMRRAEKVSA